MRFLVSAPLLILIACTGCSNKPSLREEPVEVKGTVKLPGNASPKGLTITFVPQQNSPPAGAKVEANGEFTLKVHEGKYIVYFTDEANASVPAYKHVTPSFRQPSESNTVKVEKDGQTMTIDVR